MSLHTDRGYIRGAHNRCRPHGQLQRERRHPAFHGMVPLDQEGGVSFQPDLAITFHTRVAICGLTLGTRLTTRESVAAETRARLAMSRISMDPVRTGVVNDYDKSAACVDHPYLRKHRSDPYCR